MNSQRRSSLRLGVVLAAGAGSRMGGPKALLEYQGSRLIERAVKVAFAGGCDRVVAVLGASSAEAKPFAGVGRGGRGGQPPLAGGHGLLALHGTRRRPTLVAPDAVAALVLLVDQPDITKDAVSAVLSAHRDPEDPTVLAAAAYDGKRGHPVLLGRAHWDKLIPTLTGDFGARSTCTNNRNEVILVPCDRIADPRDLDRPEDL